ncbi:glycosyltransferase family 2 protein [bacterium]|nr:glycosyltransferase family 2 protein [bacterium]MCI0604723.1 glycosyltransferase family 2 protein [bacterium]
MDRPDKVASTLSLVIPAYNEEKRLDSHGHAFEYIRSIFRTVEILYVDDGSTDGTFLRLLDYEKQNPHVRILRHERNLGKGRAVRTGMEAATGDLVLFSDVDFSTPIEEVQKLLHCIHNGFDVAFGSRGVPGSNVEIRQSLLRQVTGKIGNAIVQSLLLLPYTDTQCGFKLYKAEALKIILPRLTVDGFAFDMEMLAVALAHGLKVAEVPVTWRNVLDSRVRAIHNLEVLQDVLRIRYRMAMGYYS